MGDVALPPLPPLPPPVGSAVRPSISAGTPPPPTGPPPLPVADEVDDARYVPPGWLTKERGVDRTNTVSPKVVVLSVAGLAVLLVAMGLVVALLAGTADERFVDLDEVELDRPTFPDQDMFVESMADPSAPVVVRI